MESEEDDVPSKEKDKDSEELEEPPNEGIFREVSEVRFPAEVGPLGTHRLCKIKCIEGMWQGPLCAAPDQEEGAMMKFEPLYKRCVVDQIPPHLLLSYKNVSVVRRMTNSLLNFSNPITFSFQLDTQLGSPAWTHTASPLRRFGTVQTRRRGKSFMFQRLMGTETSPMRPYDTLDQLFRR